MTPKTIEHLHHQFVSKVCSIVCVAMNRAFTEEISREHFVIRVSAITADGIWGTHPLNEALASFFFIDQVISIHEEIELDPEKPEHAKAIADFENKTGQKLEGDIKGQPKKTVDLSLPVLAESPVETNASTGDSIFVDIKTIEGMVERTKRTYDIIEVLG